MADIQLLLEAERRGILPADKAGLLTEARRRGLIPPIQQPSTPEPALDLSQPDPAERARVQDELTRNIAAADQAGKTLRRQEIIAEVARPLLMGTTIPADAFTAIPRLATNLGIEGVNRVFGTEIPKVAPLTTGELLPKNTGERYAAAVTSGLAGALTGIGVGQQLATSASPVTQAVGNTLAANPGLQATAATTGSASGQFAADAGAGPVGQTLANVAGSFVPGATLSTAQKVAGGFTRTAEAQRLLDQGVDLTPGQLNPKGIYNQFEENVQALPFVGPAIRNARENARSTFQRAATQESAAPGATVKQADPATMLDEAYQSFQPLYDQAKGFPVRPVIVNQGANTPIDSAVRQAVRSRSVFATADQRRDVLRFVNNELTRGLRSSDDLLRIRSVVRARARERLARNDADSADLLSSVDDVLTRALESQLPARPLQALRTADAQYVQYKTIEKAVARSKDRPDGFTPNDLSEAVAASGRGAVQGSYARGGGGSLRELAADGRKVLDARSPPTGQRLAVLAPGAALAVANPAAGVAFNAGVAGGVLALSATQTGRRIAAGTTDAQRALSRQLSAANIDVPLVYKQALANSVTQQASEQLAKVSPARELVFLDPESSPEQAALAKASISRKDPASYKAMVREFLAESYGNPGSVAQDPNRIRAVLPADAPDALKEVFQAAQELSKASPSSSGRGAISDALRAQSVGSLQFLLSPGQGDPVALGASIDTLTDVLLDPQKRLQLRQATRQKDPEKRLLLLGSLFARPAASAENAGLGQ